MSVYIIIALPVLRTGVKLEFSRYGKNKTLTLMANSLRRKIFEFKEGRSRRRLEKIA